MEERTQRRSPGLQGRTWLSGMLLWRQQQLRQQWQQMRTEHGAPCLVDDVQAHRASPARTHPLSSCCGLHADGQHRQATGRTSRPRWGGTCGSRSLWRVICTGTLRAAPRAPSRGRPCMGLQQARVTGCLAAAGLQHGRCSSLQEGPHCLQGHRTRRRTR